MENTIKNWCTLAVAVVLVVYFWYAIVVVLGFIALAGLLYAIYTWIFRNNKGDDSEEHYG